MPCVVLHVGCGDTVFPFLLLGLAELAETGVADTIVVSPGHFHTTNESASFVTVVSRLASGADWVVHGKWIELRFATWEENFAA